MSTNEPPPNASPLQAALEHLRRILVSPDGKPIDPTTASWSEIERGAILLLGGAFSPETPGHLDVVVMLAAALADRLSRELGAFWFQNRATPHGAAVGFPGAILVFSPFDAVFGALTRSKLSSLEEVTSEIRTALARHRSPEAAERPLGPADYQRLFDPGLVQFLAIDPGVLSQALGATAADTVRDFEHGFSKLSAQIPAEARTQLGREIQTALRRLPAASPLGNQIPAAPQLIEFVALATSVKAATGVAPAEFWAELLLPLLHVGAASGFAEPDEEELAAYRAGADPLLLYIDVVPYQRPAADEDGLLGVVPPEHVRPLDPRWADSPGVRLLQLDPSALRDVVDGFDAAAIRSSIERFAASYATAAGGAVSQPTTAPGQPPLLDLVLLLAEDLKRVLALVAEKGWALALRYATESEISSEPIVQDLRRALREPRIVLA